MSNVISHAAGQLSKITGLPSGMPGADPVNYAPNAPDFTGQYGTAVGDVRSLMNPYVNAGKRVLPQLGDETSKGFTMGDFTADPGYQFTLSQGLQSVQNAAGTQGSPFGGQAQREMMQYSTGLANQTYQNAFNRWQTQIQNLQQLAGLGANAGQAESGTLANLFSGLTGAQANVYGTQGGMQSSEIGRGGSFWGALSNLGGI